METSFPDNKEYLQLQFLRLHSLVSLLAPSHVFPPYIGAGFVQFRCRCFEPGPHVLEHDDHVVHIVQSPSTSSVEKLV